jgi:hypothetical protein
MEDVITYSKLRFKFTKGFGRTNTSMLDHFLATGAFTKFGIDKNGSQTYIFIVKKFDALAYSLKDKINFMCYFIDLLNESINNEGKKLSVVYDQKGHKKEVHDDEPLKVEMRKYRESLMHYMTEKIEKMYFLNLGFIMQSLYTVGKYFIPDKFREKLIVLSDTEDLLDYFNLEDINIDHLDYIK